MKRSLTFCLAMMTLAVMLTLTGCAPSGPQTSTHNTPPNIGRLPGFASEQELVTAFTNGRNQGYPGVYYRGELGTANVPPAPVTQAAVDAATNGVSYSDTNVQVAGVDEADVVKTDGKYIYVVAHNSLYLAQAYPAESARILAHLDIPGFTPQELFVDGDHLMVFGSTYFSPSDSTGGGQQGYPPTAQPGIPQTSIPIMPYRQANLVSAKLYDIKDRSNPKLLKSVDIEGTYLTSRRIGSDVYFVINSYPSFVNPQPLASDIIPGYRETAGNAQPSSDLKPIASYNEIGYIPPLQASNFITVASLSMSDAGREVGKTVIVGSGQNVFASPDNLYIAQTSWPTL